MTGIGRLTEIASCYKPLGVVVLYLFSNEPLSPLSQINLKRWFRLEPLPSV